MPVRRFIQPVYKPVRDHQRIAIPAEYCEAIGLQAAVEIMDVLLWMIAPGRYRMLIGADMGAPDVAKLREAMEVRPEPHGPTEFDDDASTVMGVRILEARLSRGKECRLSLPDIIMDVLKIRREERAVVVCDGRFVEIWSVDTFEATFRVSTAALLC
jgi:DNA-binding transcriptional regulator/RsmH inhibitor MraZ